MVKKPCFEQLGKLRRVKAELGKVGNMEFHWGGDHRLPVRPEATNLSFQVGAI